MEKLLDKYVPEFEEPAQPMKLNLPKLKKVGDTEETPKVALPKLRKVGEPQETPKVALPKLKKIER